MIKYKQKYLLTITNICICLVILLPSGLTQAATMNSEAKYINRGYAHPERLASVEWVKNNKDKKNVILLDLQKKAKNGVIPGSVHLNFAKNFKIKVKGKNLTTQNNMIGGYLPTKKMVRNYMRRLGATPKSIIVIYDDANNVLASRGLFILEVYGFKNTKLLDGSFTSWKNANKSNPAMYPINKKQKNLSMITKSNFEFWSSNLSLLVDYDNVVAALYNDKIEILDSRSKGEYDGTIVKQPKTAKGGHIPGAIHIEWVEGFEKKTAKFGQFKSRADLEKLFNSRGISKDSTVYAHCQ